MIPQPTAASMASKTVLYQPLTIEWVKYIARPININKEAQNNRSQRDFPLFFSPEALAFLAI
jgi:hypothetical protein